jgi:hypothetical protein
MIQQGLRIQLQCFQSKFIDKAQLDANIKAVISCLTYIM